MKASETVLFSDLDGTLFDSHNVISEDNLRAISDYIDAGGLFAVATGRAPQNARTFFTGLRQNCPAIVMNGAGAWDFTKDGYLFCAHMDRSKLDPLLTRLLSELPDLELQVYTEGMIHYCMPEERCHPILLRLHRPCQFGTYADTLGLPLVKCLLYVPPEHDARLGAALAEAAPGTYSLTPGQIHVEGQDIHFYEIMPEGVCKAVALERLRALPFFQGRTIIAAGDNWNDLEFLRAADVAVTPANAVPEAKALSRFTVASNEDSAIAQLIRDVIPQL